MFPRARFTLLADTNQAIVSGVNTVDSKALASIYNAKTMCLGKSYRSTQEINTFAISLLPEDSRYEIFNRSGENVDNVSGNIDALGDLLNTEAEKRSTLAIITKTAEEARNIHRELIKDFPGLRLCDNKSCALSSAPVVMPLALTKGLEFDGVVIIDNNKNFTAKENEKYLYLASTRALHKLTIFEM